MMNILNNPLDLIPEPIREYWQNKYGNYLNYCQSQDFIIFYENGTLNNFHPSGDRLARHDLISGRTIYIWDNTKFVSEQEYLSLLLIE